MLKWVRSILGQQKDMELNSSLMNKNEWQSSQNSPNDLTTSRLVSKYSMGNKLSDEELNNFAYDGRIITDPDHEAIRRHLGA